MRVLSCTVSETCLRSNLIRSFGSIAVIAATSLSLLLPPLLELLILLLDLLINLYQVMNVLGKPVALHLRLAFSPNFLCKIPELGTVCIETGTVKGEKERERGMRMENE